MKKLITTIGLATLSISAFAGDKGNGGNSAVCFESPSIVKEVKENGNRISNGHISSITSVTPLDLYEARSYYDRNSDSYLFLPNKNETAEEYAYRFAKRFEYLGPLVTIIEKNIKKINENKKFYPSGGIDRIYDTAESYYLDPDLCVIATVIRQSKSDTGRSTLEFDKRLYDFKAGTQDNRNLQGVLMVHEAILSWALDLGHTHAKNARELTAYLLRKDISRDDVFKKLRDTRFVTEQMVAKSAWQKCGDVNREDYYESTKKDAKGDSIGGICVPKDKFSFGNIWIISEDQSSSFYWFHGEHKYAKTEYLKIQSNLSWAADTIKDQSLHNIFGEVKRKLKADVWLDSIYDLYVLRDLMIEDSPTTCKALHKAEVLENLSSKISSHKAAVKDIESQLAKKMSKKKRLLLGVDLRTYQYHIEKDGAELIRLNKENEESVKCRRELAEYLEDARPRYLKAIAQAERQFDNRIESVVREFKTTEWIPTVVSSKVEDIFAPECKKAMYTGGQKEVREFCHTVKLK